MRAVRIHAPGPIEAMRLEMVPLPEPGPGSVLVRIEAAGVNFIDIYKRNGLYSVPLPATLGEEACGVVEKTGAGVGEFKPGDRVGWAGTLGAYAQYAVVPADRLVSVPDSVPAPLAAASLLQGMTAHYLATDTFRLEPGHVCLITAAAGGVGTWLVQVAELRGARVLAAVGSEEKAATVRRLGADDVIVYRDQDLVETVRELTRGRGVDVVYDGVGRATFEAGLDCLRPRGTMVTFGNASGPVPAIEPLLLARKGSLFLTRPVLAHYTADREELLKRAGEVLSWVESGLVKVTIHRRYDLAEVAQAHRDLESRATTGKLILEP